MRNNILVSTTNTLEGYHIERYLDLVSANTVIGTNIFSDFGASITDILGGISDTYEKKLRKIYTITLNQLRIEGTNKGANALIGLHIDFDEISGKGKSMFMVSAIATAVIIKKDSTVALDKPSAEIHLSKNMISNEILHHAVTKNIIINKLKIKESLNSEEWIFIQNNPLEEFAEDLLGLFLYAHDNEGSDPYKHKEQVDLIDDNISSYFANINPKISLDLLYREVGKDTEIIDKILRPYHLFSALHIIKLFNEGDITTVIKCLELEKEAYSYTDLELMQQLISLFDQMKNLGEIKEIKSLFSKPELVYICPKGHYNSEEIEYCHKIDYTTAETPTICGLNIKGLTEDDVKIITAFKTKTAILSEIFKEKCEIEK